MEWKAFNVCLEMQGYIRVETRSVTEIEGIMYSQHKWVKERIAWTIKMNGLGGNCQSPWSYKTDKPPLYLLPFIVEYPIKQM